MRYKGLLLDRDGVINVDHGYVCSRERLEYIEGVFPFLRQAQDFGYKIGIVTNQSGVGRKYYTREVYEKFSAELCADMRKEGIHISGIFTSFSHPKAEDERYKGTSFWRKPSPGLFLEAAQKMNLDLGASLHIGDKTSDILAAQAAGVGKCFFFDRGQYPLEEEKLTAKPEKIKNFEPVAAYMKTLV